MKPTFDEEGVEEEETRARRVCRWRWCGRRRRMEGRVVGGLPLRKAKAVVYRRRSMLMVMMTRKGRDEVDEDDNSSIGLCL